MLASFLDTIRDGDMIAPRLMAERLRVPMTQLSRIAHVNRNTLADRPGSPSVQAKLGQIARIITRAAELSGDEGRAIIWFRHQPIPGFGNRTAEELVEAGEADAVIEDLERMAEGVYS
ncbi:antitoxin Xre/MbcA/ParS toxin-binding domain-containing protein [Sphingomonas sp. PR090111-T3T-6A]|uniref:antitoxin Xre/MbcA/ParS toxin-binding domain-containing protein n=1 Tax=Sphingomonas sp. PR090111-T3T-6A TaxID=685778 RepID=UPI00036F3621|nr:antitoxin Xre/MbcA/ParS toxin-binding domain-containing protein [Sphingomonas sp. PR090111-T3T-6A]